MSAIFCICMKLSWHKCPLKVSKYRSWRTSRLLSKYVWDAYYVLSGLWGDSAVSQSAKPHAHGADVLGQGGGWGDLNRE